LTHEAKKESRVLLNESKPKIDRVVTDV